MSSSDEAFQALYQRFKIFLFDERHEKLLQEAQIALSFSRATAPDAAANSRVELQPQHISSVSDITDKLEEWYKRYSITEERKKCARMGALMSLKSAASASTAGDDTDQFVDIYSREKLNSEDRSSIITNTISQQDVDDVDVPTSKRASIVQRSMAKQRAVTAAASTQRQSMPTSTTKQSRAATSFASSSSSEKPFQDSEKKPTVGLLAKISKNWDHVFLLFHSLLEKLESWIHAKLTLNSKFLINKFRNDILAVGLQIESYITDIEQREKHAAKSEENIGEPATSSTSTPQADLKPSSARLIYALPPQSLELWTQIIEDRKSALARAQQVNPAKQKRDLEEQWKKLDSLVAVPFAEFLAHFQRYLEQHAQIVSAAFNPFMHVRTQRKSDVKKIHYLLFRLFIQSHSLRQFRPEEYSLLMTMFDTTAAGTAVKGSIARTRAESTAPSAAGQTDSNAPTQAQLPSQESISYGAKLGRAMDLNDIEVAIQRYGMVRIEELLAFSLGQDLIRNFVAAMQMLDTEFLSTKKFMSHLLYNLTRASLELSYFAKARTFENVKRAMQAANLSFASNAQLLSSEAAFSEFKKKVLLECAYKEQAEWSNIQYWVSWEKLLRQLVDSEFAPSRGFDTLPVLSLEIEMVKHLTNKLDAEAIEEEFYTVLITDVAEEKGGKPGCRFEPGVVLATKENIYFISHASGIHRALFLTAPLLQSKSKDRTSSIFVSMSESDTDQGRNFSYTLVRTPGTNVQLYDDSNRLFAKSAWSLLLDVQLQATSSSSPSVITLTKKDGTMLQFFCTMASRDSFACMQQTLDMQKERTKELGQAEIIKTGILKKEGAKVKNWKTRLFVLYADKLVYKKDESSSVLGEVRLKDVLGVEKESTSARPNTFSIMTVDRTYHIQAISSAREVNQWMTAIRMAMRRLGLAFPFVHFLVAKKNVREKYQLRHLRIDFINYSFKSIQGGKVKQEIEFSRIENLTVDKTNPLHLELQIKGADANLDLLMQTPRQANILRQLTGEIIEKNKFFTIKDALQMEPSLNTRSGYAFEMVSMQQNQTIDANNLQGKTLVRNRWLIAQVGQLVVFDGTGEGLPVEVLSLHSCQIETAKTKVIKQTVKSNGGLFKGKSTTSDVTEIDVLVLTLGDIKRAFGFASKDEAQDWQKAIQQERRLEAEARGETDESEDIGSPSSKQPKETKVVGEIIAAGNAEDDAQVSLYAAAAKQQTQHQQQDAPVEKAARTRSFRQSIHIANNRPGRMTLIELVMKAEQEVAAVSTSVPASASDQVLATSPRQVVNLGQFVIDEDEEDEEEPSSSAQAEFDDEDADSDAE